MKFRGTKDIHVVLCGVVLCGVVRFSPSSISWVFLLTKLELCPQQTLTPHPLFPPSIPSPWHLPLWFYEFDYSRYLVEGESNSVCLHLMYIGMHFEGQLDICPTNRLYFLFCSPMVFSRPHLHTLLHTQHYTHINPNLPFHPTPLSTWCLFACLFSASVSLFLLWK